MTTVRASVQQTEPPRVLVTVEDVITPPREMLVNGSFETPDMGGTLDDYAPDGWTDALGNAAVAPVQYRQGPNANVSTAPFSGSHYFDAEFPGSTDDVNGVMFEQFVPVAGGLRVIADAYIQATGNTAPGQATFVLALIAFRGTTQGQVPGLATVDSPNSDGWTNAHAELTVPPSYDRVRVVWQYVTTNPKPEPSRFLIDSVRAQVAEPDVVSVSLMREVDGVRSPVRGVQGLDPAMSNDLVVIDNEAPFSKSVTYVFVKTYVDGTTGETVSDPVELTTALPWISHPITGVGVSATITDWTDLVYAARRNVIAVAGRSRPIAISDRRLAPSSELSMLTKTRSDLLALRALLASGDVLLVRPVCDAVEGDYLSIGDVSETRLKPTGDGAGADWRRLVRMDAQSVEMPDTSISAVGDTLADLAAYVPTTLADLAAAFGAGATLLTIAETNLEAG